MRWKSLLTVLVVLVLIGLIFFTPTGKNFTANVSKIISSLSTLLTFKQPSENYTTFTLTLDLDNKPSFAGQSYQMANGVIKVSGVFTDDVIIGNSKWEKKVKRSEMSIENFNGKFDVTTTEFTVKFVGDSTHITVDNQGIFPLDDKLTVSADVYPIELFVAPIIKDKISLSGITGKIENIDTGGMQPLNNDNLDITNFIGRIQLTNSSIIITGSATKITGKGFSWTW